MLSASPVVRILQTCIVVLALGVGLSAHADWSTGTGGNSSRNGRSPHAGPDAPDLLWSGGLPAIHTRAPVIAGDTLVMSRVYGEGWDAAWIVAHDLDTGAVRWQTKLPVAFATTWRSRVSAVRDGRVYATRAGNNRDDYIYALDLENGDLLWRSDAIVEESTTESLAFAENGDLIVGNVFSLVRIEATSGRTVWSVPRYCPTSHGCAATVRGDRTYVWQPGAGGPVVSRFDTGTGAFMYSSEVFSPGFVAQVSLMVGPDGTVYAPRVENDPETDALVALIDTGDGFEERWRVPVGPVSFASLGVGPDRSVYTYAPTGRILRLDHLTGAVIDRSLVIDADTFVPRMAIDRDGRLYVTNGGFEGGALFAFEADLTLRWSVDIPGVYIGGPALGPKGTLVVSGSGTDVRAFRTNLCPADLDGDATVDLGDLLLVLSTWGPCAASCPADLTGDGAVDFGDLLMVVGAWGSCP